MFPRIVAPSVEDIVDRRAQPVKNPGALRIAGDEEGCNGLGCHQLQQRRPEERLSFESRERLLSRLGLVEKDTFDRETPPLAFIDIRPDSPDDLPPRQVAPG